MSDNVPPASPMDRALERIGDAAPVEILRAPSGRVLAPRNRPERTEAERDRADRDN